MAETRKQPHRATKLTSQFRLQRLLILSIHKHRALPAHLSWPICATVTEPELVINRE